MNTYTPVRTEVVVAEDSTDLTVWTFRSGQVLQVNRDGSVWLDDDQIVEVSPNGGCAQRVLDRDVERRQEDRAMAAIPEPPAEFYDTLARD